MSKNAALISIGTAVPDCKIQQSEASALAHDLFNTRYEDYERLARVFDGSEIVSRYLACPLLWYQHSHSWAERTSVYLEVASKLFVEAAEKALRKANLSAINVDTVITVSSTGITTPSLEARVSGLMGFRKTVRRIPVFGLGCAGGVTGVSLGARLAATEPGSVVLVVAVELCSMAFHSDTVSKSNIVASALFSDGAAAAILQAGPQGIATVVGSGEYTWPDTLGIMGWDVDERGLNVIFDRAIPPFTRANMKNAVAEMLAGMNIDASAIDRYICHPGGKKVITALEDSLDMARDTLDHERFILANYGNMSAPTVLFVLERVIEHTLPDFCLMAAMGPGFTASTVALKKAP